jgi:hypothetical protein
MIRICRGRILDISREEGVASNALREATHSSDRRR